MPDAAIVDHYGTSDLITRVDDVLRGAGLGDDAIEALDLAPLDQFHAGGLAATIDLAARLAIAPESHVLDVGCGVGGSSRYLAATFGCTVVGVDLNEPFVALATHLTRRTGLVDRVRHVVGDALHLPFAAESFDIAWTQHVVMNVADRETLYAGIFAALRPGGRFGMYDLVAGNGEALDYPVPWARDASASHLRTADETKVALEGAGFQIGEWIDATLQAFAWMGQVQSDVAELAPERRALALPLVMGPAFPMMAANIGANAAKGRLRVLMAVAEKPR